jgi:hypothetical protein
MLGNLTIVNRQNEGAIDPDDHDAS